MANWIAPTRIDAVISAGSFMRAACGDWRSVGRFHVGTDQLEPTIDAGYTTACAIQRLELSISFLAFWGSPYMMVRSGILVHRSGCDVMALAK
jgi:hypothetical protein